MKTSRLLKKSEIYSLLFFQLFELKQSEMKTATTMAPNKRLQIARSLSYAKKECSDQKFKVFRTNI